jgi:hypothetical protein
MPQVLPFQCLDLADPQPHECRYRERRSGWLWKQSDNDSNLFQAVRIGFSGFSR